MRNILYTYREIARGKDILKALILVLVLLDTMLIFTSNNTSFRFVQSIVQYNVLKSAVVVLQQPQKLLIEYASILHKV